MGKSTEVQIFMLCHTPVEYGLVDNKFVTPLECGAAIKDENVCSLKDNTGDNISALNQFYTEDTGIYWIWKNVNDCKYKGQIQYRRRFKILEDESLDFNDIFQEHDAIIAEPMNIADLYSLPFLTLETQYGMAHNIDDIKLMERIIKRDFPHYSEAYDDYIKNGKEILYSNGFILKKEDYNQYCSELFYILEKWLNETNIHSIDKLHEYVYNAIMNGTISNETMDSYHRRDLNYACKYQMRIGGSLAERFFTLFANYHFQTPLYLPYFKPEGNYL